MKAKRRRKKLAKNRRMETQTIAVPRNWPALQPHQLSELVGFGVGIDIEALAKHMSEHGYDPDEPVVLLDGQILDGRHKHQAAIKAHVKPTFKEFVGRNPLAYVAKKLYRQHLDTSQRAMMAAELTKLEPEVGVQNCTPPTLADAAGTMNVSRRSAASASKVQAEGTPALNQAVREGVVKVGDAANITDQSPDVQDRAVEAVRTGLAQTVVEAVRNGHQIDDFSHILCGKCRKDGPQPDCQMCEDERQGARTGRQPGELDTARKVEVEPEALKTIALPACLQESGKGGAILPHLSDTPPPETLIRWLETVLALHRVAVSPNDLFEQTARAIVELIGLDVGMVLLCQDQDWTVAARHERGLISQASYSRTLLQHVVAEQRTFYQDLASVAGGAAMSLQSIDAAVVSPIFGVQNEVVGMVYGVRQRGSWQSRIRPLEAQLVQLLAAAVSSHHTRATALRTRVQFEQFFSPELAHELERHPDLLEGRDQEVTILVSDLRGYTRIGQRLGAATTCKLVRDMMEQLSQRIAENGGVIVDYAGDGILAMWNAPVLQSDHAARACRAALAMLGELPALNTTWQPIIGSPLLLGIGVNSGMAQVGNTGSTRKFKYGPHGHTVNLASRVQEATKKTGAAALLTTATQERLPADFLTRPLPPVSMPGIDEPVPIYELLGEESPPRLD
jgi:class 3 adenylate cyclase